MAADVITLITRDHRTLEQLFDQVKSGEGNLQELLDQIAALLAAHSRAEEERVYPALAKAAPDEEEEVEHGTDEHHEAEQLLDRVLRSGSDSAEFEARFDEFVGAIKHHVEEEESEILPSLRASVDQAELERLGQEFAQRRRQELDSLGAGGAAAVAADATVSQLRDEARQLDIEGRSTMKKDELAREIAERS